MSKEENITQIIKGITLSTFSPKPGETVVVTFDQEIFSVEEMRSLFNAIVPLFPDNNVLMKPDGVTLESLMEDDLR